MKATDINENTKALVRITTTPDNAEILFESNDGISFISRNKINLDSQGFNETTDVSLDYGIWSITIDYGYETKTVELNVDTYKIYELDLRARLITVGISIDMDNPDPADAVTYTGDAVGFQPLAMNFDTGVCDYGDWFDLITTDILIGCKPKQRGKYVNPNDYTKYIDGTDVVNDFTTDAAYPHKNNMYIEFKRTWYRYKLEGNVLSFEISNHKQEGFYSTAFKRASHLYYSAYPRVTNSNAEGMYRTACVSGSSEYYKTSTEHCLQRCAADWNDSYNRPASHETLKVRSYILGLLMLVTKTRDIKSVIGIGNCSEDILPTGTGDSMGLFYGSQEPGHPVKCFGIENMWGNCEEIIGEITRVSAKTAYCTEHWDGNLNDFVLVDDELDSAGNGNPDLDTADMSYVSFIKPVKYNGEDSCIIPFRNQADSSIGWPDPIVVTNGGSLNKDSYNGGRVYFDHVVVGGGSGTNAIIKNPGPFSAVFAHPSAMTGYGTACVRTVFAADDSVD